MWISSVAGRSVWLLALLGALATPISEASGSVRSASVQPVQDLTYDDAATRKIVRDARAALIDSGHGIESYEARIHERTYLGVSGPRMSRSRSLVERHRMGRIRWEATGREMVRWEGARESWLGVRSDEEEWAAADLVESLANALASDAGFLHRPDGRGVGFGGAGGLRFVHPLTKEASANYRYAAGDTVRVTLPETGRTVTLVEVVTEPVRSDHDLVHASLWVDEETGELGRLHYRTARPWNLGLDTDRELLGFAERIEAWVDGVAVDYGLYGMEWWLPRRVAFHLTVRIRDVVELPAVIERRVEDYRLNTPPSEEWKPEPLPDDWNVRTGTREASAGGGEAPDTIRWMTITPPLDSLQGAPDLEPGEGPMGVGDDVGVFTPEEWSDIDAELEGLAPSPSVPRTNWMWSLGEGVVRYNRIEGLSAGVAVEAPLRSVGPRWSVRSEARVGTADFEPRGGISVRRDGRSTGEVSVEAYRRLAETSHWDSHLGLSGSLAALVAGSDRGDYYQADGVAITARRAGGRKTIRGRLHAERHRTVQRNTGMHLAGLFSADTLRANPAALEGDWLAAATSLRVHRGAEPATTRLSAATHTEAGHGPPGSYLRVGGEGAAVHRLGPFDLGIHTGVGRSWGNLPAQREFTLVGPSTLRGPSSGSVRGPAYWFARAEASFPLVDDVPGVRVAAFLDAGWAGQWHEVGDDSIAVHRGLGLSIADGAIRLDVANPGDDDGTRRFYFYLDGVL